MSNANWVEKAIVNNFVWAFIQRRHVIPVWKSSMELGRDATVLEIGCGRGAGAVYLYDAFSPACIHAFDIDDRMVRKARRFAGRDYEGRIRFYVADAANIPAGDGTYDAVFDFFTLHHVDDWKKSLSEISRILKPGGYFAFGELYGSAVKSYDLRNLLHLPVGERFDRPRLVRALAENRLRLMERKNTLWGRGMIAVAGRS